MPNIQALSNDRHGRKFWKRSQNYLHTAKDVLCPLVAHEVPQACLSLPIAFSEIDGDFTLVAVLGLEPDQNLVIDAVGQWRGPYVPRIYRSFPFSLALSNDDRILCIDEELTVEEETADTELFFKDDGQPTETVLRILDFLSTNFENSKQSASICKTLNDLSLIEPWPLQVVIDNETKSVNGLFRINEDALYNLSEKNLATLRDTRALLVIYSQLLSMSHMKSLVELAQHLLPPTVGELDFDSLDDGGTISFSNL